MATWYRGPLRVAGILLLVVASLAMAAAGMIAAVMLVLPGTVVVTFDVVVVARNADGTAVAGQEVELWGYEKAARTALTGPDGRAEFPGETIHVSTTLLFQRHRPEAFPLHIRFPQFAPLYYRYDVVRDGPPQADVFNTTYDYRFGNDWVGRFDAAGRIERVTTDEYGRPAKRAAARTDDGSVQLFRAEATILEIQGPESRWRIDLVLTPAGGWRP